MSYAHGQTDTNALQLHSSMEARVNVWDLLLQRMEYMQNSPTEYRAGGRIGRVSGVLNDRRMNENEREGQR